MLTKCNKFIKLNKDGKVSYSRRYVTDIKEYDGRVPCSGNLKYEVSYENNSSCSCCSDVEFTVESYCPICRTFEVVLRGLNAKEFIDKAITFYMENTK